MIKQFINWLNRPMVTKPHEWHIPIWVIGHKKMKKSKQEQNNYANIHVMLVYRHGKAIKCENPDCKSVSPKRYEWALRKGREYSHNISDYIQLCPSCHRKYDMTDIIRNNISKSKSGIPRPNRRKKILQANRNGDIIAIFASASEAHVITGISRTSIINVLSSRAHTAGNFIWKYATTDSICNSQK